MIVATGTFPQGRYWSYLLYKWIKCPGQVAGAPARGCEHVAIIENRCLNCGSLRYPTSLVTRGVLTKPNFAMEGLNSGDTFELSTVSGLEGTATVMRIDGEGLWWKL